MLMFTLKMFKNTMLSNTGKKQFIILQQSIYEIQKRYFIQVNYFYEKKQIRGKTNDGKYITVIHFKL